jgi:hypothetical protein
VLAEQQLVLTIVNSDCGFDPWPWYEVKPPDCQSSLETHGPLILEATGRIFGRRTDVAHPRPGSFGSPRSPNDFCEIQLLFRKRKNDFIAEWLSAAFSQVGTYVHAQSPPILPYAVYEQQDSLFLSTQDQATQIIYVAARLFVVCTHTHTKEEGCCETGHAPLRPLFLDNSIQICVVLLSLFLNK